jgi:amino acid transporter
VHPAYRTPHVAVVVAAVLALACGLTSSFSQAAALAAVARLAVFLVTVATVVVLRRKDGRAPFHVWGGPLVSLVAMIFCVWLLSTRPVAQLGLLVAAGGVGFVIHALRHRAGGVVAAESPSA